MSGQNKNQIKKKAPNKIIIIGLLIVFIFGLNRGVTRGAAVDDELAKIKADLEQRQQRIDQLTKESQAYDQALQQKRSGVATLKNQLGILDDNVSKLTVELNTTQLESEQTNLQISDLELRINLKSQEVQQQQARVSKIIQALDNNDHRKLQIFLVLINGSFGQFFQEINQLQAIEQSLTAELKNLRILKIQMEDQQASLQDKQTQLTALQSQLADNQERLNTEKAGKQSLLTLTKGQEDKYQKMLAANQAEQAQINNEIQNLAVLLKKKLANSPGGLANISDKGFMWPVPSRRIATTFHDPDYPFRYVYEHPGIDIGGTPQGTPVRAAASGYVGKVKNGGYGYSYILLVHKDGLATVYGHLSKLYAQEDTYVAQGEIIGLSGGTPGTPGAGNLTTGPHLHFEIRQDGIPINPMSYLP